MRTKQINMRLSDEEADRLHSICEHYGINNASLLRMLLKQEHDRLTKPLRITAFDGWQCVPSHYDRARPYVSLSAKEKQEVCDQYRGSELYPRIGENWWQKGV